MRIVAPLLFASRSAALASSLALCAACSKPAEPAPAEPTAAAPTSPAPSQAPASPHAPAPSAAAAAPSDQGSAGGLRFRAPKPFVPRAPKSSMRAAEFGIENDAASELAVFYFGADQGGSVDANMTRWIGQFKKPDGSDAEAKRGERSVHGLPVATVEALGTYNGGMGMPGAPAPAAITDAMLLGAIVKGPEGAVFFKLVGPRDQLEAARPAFDQLLESIEH
ncbi:MAG: hypothetical protein ABW321_25070 [Polyangiales bacterium]